MNSHTLTAGHSLGRPATFLQILRLIPSCVKNAALFAGDKSIPVLPPSPPRRVPDCGPLLIAALC